MQCSYELVTITWKRWPTHWAALGGFLVGCVELGMSGFSKWRALKVSISGSNSPKNRGETGIFAKDKA